MSEYARLNALGWVTIDLSAWYCWNDRKRFAREAVDRHGHWMAPLYVEVVARQNQGDELITAWESALVRSSRTASPRLIWRRI